MRYAKRKGKKSNVTWEDWDEAITCSTSSSFSVLLKLETLFKIQGKNVVGWDSWYHLSIIFFLRTDITKQV